MKQKILYILAIVIISCMSLFSSAKQKGSDCDSRCPLSKSGSAKNIPSQKTQESGYELLPLSLFMFSK
jgi:hypothetical protein